MTKLSPEIYNNFNKYQILSNINCELLTSIKIGMFLITFMLLICLSPFIHANERQLNTSSHGQFTSFVNTSQNISSNVAFQIPVATINKNRETIQNLIRVSGNEKVNASLSTDKNVIKPLPLKGSVNSYSVEYSADFYIFDANSVLDDDLDFDGYYQTFTIGFDADVDSYTSDPSREVYALLYLRKENGPWIHYFTTNSFIIIGDSEDDAYEVTTTLIEDYIAGHYDVLIDLYQVGYNEAVATFSSDDSNALYALPLESNAHDIYYEEVIIVEEITIEQGYGGSLSYISLFFVFFVGLIRMVKLIK